MLERRLVVRLLTLRCLQEPLLPQADVRNIEDYADQLYEAAGQSTPSSWQLAVGQDRMEKKVIGVKHILRVCTEAHAKDV